MARFGLLHLAFAFLCLISSMRVAATAVRVDDLVILNGTVLIFDPVDGLNDTTRDSDWQLGYMKSLVDFRTLRGVKPRSELISKPIISKPIISKPINSTLEKRVSSAALCLQCMVDTLLLVHGGDWATRVYVAGICNAWCVYFSVASIGRSASVYAGELGYDWVHGKEQEVWRQAPID